MTDLADRYARAEALLPANALRHAFGWLVQPRWIGETGDFWYRVRRRDGLRFIRVDPVDRTARPAFDHAALAAALARRTGQALDPDALPLRAIIPVGDAIRFTHDGTALLFDAAGGLRDDPAPPSGDSLPAPDGRRAVILRDHNMHLLENGTSRPLTTDGVAHFGWGAEPGGTMDALSEAAAPPAAQWSPCGRWLLVFRCDERAVREMPVQGQGTAGGRPVTHALRVPLIGDPVTETASFWVIDTHHGTRTRIDIPPFAAMESPFWFARQGLDGPQFWSPDGDILLTRRETGGRAQTLYRADPATGAAHIVIDERGHLPVFLNAFEFARPIWRVLPATGEILCYSAREGWGQLYLHAADGTLLHRIAPGDYALRDVLAVDEGARLVWFTAQGLCPSGNPYHRHLMRASLDGGAAERLTDEPLEHVLTAAPCGRFFVDLMGAPDQPSRTVLRDRDGAIVMDLEQADAADLFARGYRPPDRATPTARDGRTPIEAAIFLPPDFDPARRYPVLDAIYGWSQVTVVPHGFLLDTGGPLEGGIEIGAENALLPAATAALGFVVVVIDGRGTPYRDRAFHAPAFDDPALATGLADHAAAIRELAATRPWMDLTRVGIFGHSGGGATWRPRRCCCTMICSAPPSLRPDATTCGFITRPGPICGA
ncbi:MAG: Dipeptidyl peptidase IV (DPP IV) N-terminal region [Rhodobacteraceae bacterium HLUCCA08]|nr:MAG: Dipeptidyl peptidase IV (DPP IV) N-terminal region [Rhodobacteraceae bacterium HLUCCA08]